MQETTVGVALITEKVAIVIPPGVTSGLCWSETDQLVRGVTTTTSSTVAAKDYKGKANTETIVKALGQNAPAAYYCSNYTFKNGKKGYLMAAGEAREIYLNIQKITELLDYISPDSYNISPHYNVLTSTQYDNSTAWSCVNSKCTDTFKGANSDYVVPICSLLN